MIRCPVCHMPSYPPLSWSSLLARCGCWGGPTAPHFHVFCKWDGQRVVTQ